MGARGQSLTTCSSTSRWTPSASCSTRRRRSSTCPTAASGCRSSSGAAWAWTLGATHHSGSYYPIFTNIPGFRVAVHDHAGRREGAPEDGDPVRRPVVFMEHRSLLQAEERCRTGAPGAVRPRGRARRIGRDGGRHHGHGAATVAAADVLAREASPSRSSTRGRWPARPRHHPRVRPQDRPPPDR